ncbi:MAG: ATP-binding protein, partial [Oscillospiraceae bacterium]|nr:ATP-binding protein [Oscillospiraceae bacterium]
WADEPYATARYALISRMDYPNLETNQVIRTKTGVVAGTAYEDLLNEWFPGHPNQYPHVSHYDVFDALESGEVDLVLASESILSFQINYRENPDYKANIVFHSPPEESSFGFNKDQHLLRSIISKAQSHINTGKIENHWKSRVYDYSARVARVRSRYLSVAAAVLLLMLAVMSVLFVKNVQTRNLYKSAVEKATEASKAKSIFLARMSHEIRTPMNTIVGISQMQLQKSGMHEDYSKAFEYIYDAGNTLLAIINDILDMSKIETGKMELSPIEYNLPGLINDVVTLNVMRIGSKPIELSLDINENLPLKVRGDELRLKEILTNLLSNAIKYTDEGSVKISVSHVPQDGGVTLRFTVEDTGHGIKTEDMPKLFTEFMRFDASTNHYIEGTGLGLSIAKNFVELMGGTIEAESEYGAGSKFTVTVEQELVSGEIIGKELSERFRNFTFKGDRRFQNIQIIHYPMPYGKVLVVDDVRSNLFVAEGLLLPYELQIETALSGYEAIKKIFVGHTYDIIFMDHMMPQMDGIETTRKLRESGYKGTIIALTANALLGNDVMFKQNGFDDFIPKPIDIRYLNAVLNQYIRDRYPEEAAKHKLTVKEGRRNSQPSALNQKLLKLFRIDAEEALAALGQSMTGGDMKLYTTKVHAMKSALANIGQNELSQVAAALENAGRTGDTAFISAHHDHFVTSLEALIRRLETAEPAAPPDAEPAEEDTAYLSEQLLIIRKACEDYDDAAVYAALDRLKEKPWKAETAAVLEEIHDLLFIDSNFESVEARILTLMKEE